MYKEKEPTKKRTKKKVANRSEPEQNRLRAVQEKLPRLVRDKIPENLIKENNLIPVYHFASEEEYVSLLPQMLREAFEKLMEPQNFERFMKGHYSELADVLTVLDSLVKAGAGIATHITSGEIDILRTQKDLAKGRFDKRIVLEDILDRRELK